MGQLEEKQFRSGELVLNYAEGPPGGAPFVYLHGMTGCWWHVSTIAPALMCHWHLYAIDQRGHGKSGRASQPYTIRLWADDLKRFLAECVGEPAILFGHSLGAIVSVMAAAELGEHVSALIVGDAGFTTEYADRVADGLCAYFHDMQNVAARDDSLEETERSLRAAVTATWTVPPDLLNTRWEARHANWLDPEIFTSALAYFEEQDGVFWQGYDAHTLLPRITCPVLMVQGNPEPGGLMLDSDVELGFELLTRAYHLRLDSVGHEMGLMSWNTGELMQGLMKFLIGLE